MATCPTLSKKDFESLRTDDTEEVARLFSPWVRKVHTYINRLPEMQDLQQARHAWKAWTKTDEAFGSFKPDPQHWYTFNHGGRTEAQFNIGMFPEYLRVGLGFEFTLKQGGDPTKVQYCFVGFLNAMRRNEAAFPKFVIRNNLRIEFNARGKNTIDYVEPKGIVDWLKSPPCECDWIFIGRLLEIGDPNDARILSSASDLGGVIGTVFAGFRPFWEEGQRIASI